MKRLFKRFILTAAIVTVAFTAIIFFYSNELYSLRVNTKKYSEINEPKNTGAKRLLLSIASYSANLIPAPDFVQIVRENEEVGYGGYKPQVEGFFYNTIFISSVDELLSALAKAKPGDDLIMKPGIYRLNQKKISLGSSGSTTSPIRLRALHKGSVTLKLISIEGFYVDKANWILENLIITGDCDLDDKCQHAIHIVGDADNLIIQNNHFKNFNAHIKSNGFIEKKGVGREFPDNVRIRHNSFTNEWQRLTASPVTPIDVVGGNYWEVSNNFIADFSKLRGNKTAYGAFLKGGGTEGVFENNLVACEWKVPHISAIDIRIGLSFGGGGTAAALCQNENCRAEHSNGKLRSNTIVNCKNDVGIYLNKAENTKVVNNLLFNTLGVDVRFSATSATLQQNIIQGRVRARDGALLEQRQTRNLTVFDTPIEYFYD